MSQSASISALIWSVADLLRGDYKPAAKIRQKGHKNYSFGKYF